MTNEIPDRTWWLLTILATVTVVSAFVGLWRIVVWVWGYREVL